MMQQTLRQYNGAVATPEEKIEIRVSINTGEVQVQDSDILGEPVNVASRLEGITEVNEVWFTESTYLAMNKQEVPTSFIGEFRFKGVPEAQKIYRAIIDPDSEFFKKMLTAQSQRSIPTESAAAGQAGSSVSINIGSTALLILVTLIVLGVGAWQAQRWSRVKTLLQTIPAQTQQAQLLAARQSLEELLRLDPANEQFVRLGSDWLLSRIRGELKAQGVSSATQALSEAYALFPRLQPLPLAEAEIKIAEALKLIEDGKKYEAMKIVDTLESDHAKNFDIVRLVAGFYDRTGVHWYRGIVTMEAAYRLAPDKMASDPAFLEWVTYFLRQVSTDDDVPTFRQLIRERFLPQYRSMLETSLYDPDPEKATLRHNARDFLTNASPPVTIDLFRFNVCDLAVQWPNLNAPETAAVSDFFLNSEFQFPKATEATDRAWISSLTVQLEDVRKKAEEAYGEDARRNGENATATRRLDALRKALNVLQSRL